MNLNFFKTLENLPRITFEERLRFWTNTTEFFPTSGFASLSLDGIRGGIFWKTHFGQEIKKNEKTKLVKQNLPVSVQSKHSILKSFLEFL